MGMTLAEGARVRIVHRRQWGAWIFAGVVTLLVALVIAAGIKVKILDVPIFLRYLTSEQVLIGARNTVMIGTVSLLLAIVLGLVVALMRVSGNIALVGFSATYVYFFRGTPLLIQLLFWFNAFPTMFPRLHIVDPVTGTLLIDAPMTELVTPTVAAIAGFALSEAAYMAEIIRGGILAVDVGQRDAARSIGMTRFGVMRHVVIPQAGRIIIPATGNQYILMLKSTSLASTIGYLELLRITTDIYSSNFRVVELLAVAGFWYLVMAALATALQTGLERLFPQR
jgi:polar amino acid transport system permease protein